MLLAYNKLKESHDVSIFNKNDSTNNENKSASSTSINTITITNLPPSTKRDDLEEHFSAYGNVMYLDLLFLFMIVSDTKIFSDQRIAYLMFESLEEAEEAISLSGTIFNKKVITVKLNETNVVKSKETMFDDEVDGEEVKPKTINKRKAEDNDDDDDVFKFPNVFLRLVCYQEK